MDNGFITLHDIVETKSLQQLQSNMAVSTKVTSVILDTDGKPFTDIVYINGLCKLIQEKHGLDLCLKTIRDNSLIAKSTKCMSATECPYIGVIGVSIPILADGEYLGAWTIGQVRLTDGGALKPISEIAAAAGVSEEKAQELLEGFPSYTTDNFRETIWLANMLINEIVNLSAAKIHLHDNNEQLSLMKDSLENSLDALRTFADASDAYMCMTDYYTGEILMCNTAYAEFYGKTVEESIGAHCYENNGFVSRCSYCPRLGQKKGNQSKPPAPTSWEHFCSERGVALKGSSNPVHWVDGRLANMSVSVDITRRKKMEDDLYALAFFDQLLKLPNAEHMMKDMRLGRLHDFLIAISLSDLRKINNLFGRSCGDMLLQEVRDFLLGLEIPNSVLYRGQFSEFYILFRNTDDLQTPLKMAEIIVKRLRKAWEFSWNGQDITLMTSAAACVIPLSNYQEHFFSFLFNAIDQCLALSNKTDQVIVYDDDVRESLNTSQKMEMCLRKAVNQGMEGFHLEYQPIVDISSAKWKGVEALCRWTSVEFGAVPPSIFIPLAESGGLINAIGIWVLETAVRQSKELGLDLVDGFLLEINVSPIQFFSEGLDRDILELLERYDFPPEMLGLEITESNELNFSKRNMEAISRLSEKGVVIVLDDFGTGYSSFNTLHKLPVKVVKTERSFVSGIESDKYLRNLLSFMVTLAHGSKLQMVAEGVENYSQVEFLLKQGTDFFQGYFFSPPLRVEALREQSENFCYPMDMLKALDVIRSGASDTGYNQTDFGYSQFMDKNPDKQDLINRCVREAMLSDDSHRGIHKIMTLIGNALNVSRAYIFLKEDDGTFSNSIEWYADGISPSGEFRRYVPVKENYKPWMEAILNDGLLMVPDVRMLKKEHYDGLTGEGALAVIATPVWRDDILFGFICLEDCVSTRYWAKEEIQTLYTLSSLITAVLNRFWLFEEVAETSGFEPADIINDAITYVTDLETNEILFVNNETQKLYNYKQLNGRICWEAFHNKKERCEFCSISYLLKHPGVTRNWEYYDEGRERLYRVQNSIIPWIGGKMAHMQLSVAISMARVDVSSQILYL